MFIVLEATGSDSSGLLEPFSLNLFVQKVSCVAIFGFSRCSSGEGHKTRGCRRVTYPESCITKNTTYTKRQIRYHPQTASLIPQPSTLNPQPSTLNPQPSALNPQPSTLNPQPSTFTPQQHCDRARRWGRGKGGSSGSSSTSRRQT